MSLNDVVEDLMKETDNVFSRNRLLNYYIKGIQMIPRQYQGLNYIDIMVYAQRKTLRHFKEIRRKQEYGNNYENR